MAAAFAAVVAARLRSLAGAVAISLAMGVVTDVVQEYLPPSSSFTAAIIPSIPFGFILIFLIIYLLRSGSWPTRRRPVVPWTRRSARPTRTCPARLVAEDGSIGAAPDDLCPLSRSSRSPCAAHLPRLAVLVGPGRRGHVLRHRLPLLHGGHRRRRNVVALPDHLRRRRGPRRRPVRHRLAPSRPARHPARGTDHGGRRRHHRPADHPTGRPLCGAGHPQFRAAGRDAGLHPEPVLAGRAGRDDQPTGVRQRRPGLLLPGLRRVPDLRRPHRQPPPLDDRPRSSGGPGQRGRSRTLG